MSVVPPARPEPTKRCPFCAEVILAAARKCKHCGEFLDEAARPPKATKRPRRPEPAPVADEEEAEEADEADIPEPASSRWVLVGAVALYAFSFLLPVIKGDAWLPGQKGDWPGGFQAFGECLSVMLDWKVDRGGWWIITLAWLVNPAIWLSMLATVLGARRWARILALCGLCMALPILFKETPEHGVAWHPGFWVWWGSALLLFIGSFKSRG